MTRNDELEFHNTWLGEVQPLEGLTFSAPVLADGGVMLRLRAVEAAPFTELVAASPSHDGADGVLDGEDEDAEQAVCLPPLASFLTSFLGWNASELRGVDTLPPDLALRLADEGTELRPIFAVLRGPDNPSPGDEEGTETPASRAGVAYQLLAWEVPSGLDLDAAESETNDWHYPPCAKLERLLRETRVPIGLLSNGHVLRLLYCPHGQSTGWVSFNVAYMATAAGRDVLSAMRELLHADRVLGGMPGTPTTLTLLAQSRERQAEVTTSLGAQMLDGLHILLEGFELAAVRDGDMVLREAMREEGEHVYEGLLTVMLRLVFSLYAEDRGLVPVEHPVYAEHLSVTGLYDQLQADADSYGDTMDQRFGAWPRLIALFRALYFGIHHGDLRLPPHRGRLFNPERFPFLEGCVRAGAAPVSADHRARTRLPSLSDGVILRVLQRLLYLDGQRLSYRALEEEQLGSVYEGLMGYSVERRMHVSVCLRPSRFWVSPEELLELPTATRVRWLRDGGLAAEPAKRLAGDLQKLEKAHAGDASALHAATLERIRKDSIAPRGRARGAGGPRAWGQVVHEVAAGKLVLQPGDERRRTSSHYTPRSLSGPIVRRTLDPLLAAMRGKARTLHPDAPDPQPSSEDLLQLKICDPAMGSGAFLVETCRYLADQLTAAWVREGTFEAIVGEAGDGEATRDPRQIALRMVAQHCLYGVDKNPLAVELGKLSLWLLTLSRGQTFTFLDHCLKAGDSLVGLSRAQIIALDWSLPAEGAAPPADATAGKKPRKKRKRKKGQSGLNLDLFAGQTQRAFDRASLARRKLAALSTTGDRSAVEDAQHRLHIEAEEALERLRDVADVLLSAYFFPSEASLVPEYLFSAKKPSDAERLACQNRLRDALNLWLLEADDPPLPPELDLRRQLVRDHIRPMHWELEFPEAFADDRPDPLAVEGAGAVRMDAVVGNPPFMGGSQISGQLGQAFLAWCLHAFAPAHGNADLSAYFFRRAHWMLGAHGTLGLIATNTIGQGDTRFTSLQPLVASGAHIYGATRNLKWPVGGAKVSVSIVHMAVGSPEEQGIVVRLDGQVVDAVNSRLRATPERPDPVPLRCQAGRCFSGTKIYGNGFVLTPEEREALVEADRRNDERIFPYLGGEELNNSPTQSHHRYVIDFGDMSLEEAEAWPDLLAIVREKVKPERDRNKRDVRKRYWWRFGERAPALYRAVRSMPRCLACSIVTKHSVFAYQPTDRIFSHRLAVFPLGRWSDFGVLQSRVHSFWAWLLSSTMRSDLNYSPSDCFETFPFPDQTVLEGVDASARALYESRALLMTSTERGLTKTYNALKDPEDQRPEIVALRTLHEDLDRAVLAAYGRGDIEVPPYVGATEAALEHFEDQVLDLLFARNEQLAEAEAEAAARAQD